MVRSIVHPTLGGEALAELPALPAAGGLDVLDLEVTARLGAPLRSHLRFLGPTIRGAFGHTLLRRSCTRDGECKTCDLVRNCAYPIVFEGHPDPDRSVMRRYDRVPQPFVLRVAGPNKERVNARDLEFSIRLFGSASRWIPEITDVLQMIGSTGLGQDRTRFEIKNTRLRTIMRANDSQPATLKSPVDGLVRWTFETPIHLSHNADHPPLDGLRLIIAGRRRWHLLTSLFGHPPTEAAPPRLESDAFTTVHESIRPWSITRFSGRQKRSVPLRGMTGSISIAGPWSQAGTWMPRISSIHLGKHGSFGFGAVRWEQVDAA